MNIDYKGGVEMKIDADLVSFFFIDQNQVKLIVVYCIRHENNCKYTCTQI